MSEQEKPETKEIDLDKEANDPEAILEIQEAFGMDEETARKAWKRFLNRTLHKMEETIKKSSDE